MVRKHREAIGYTQEEFAFLIGRNFLEVQKNEDLTTRDSYDINYTNLYARILGKQLKDMFIPEAIKSPSININATKTVKKNAVLYNGEIILKGETFTVEEYTVITKPNYSFSKEDLEQVVAILDQWLESGYFKQPITAYTIFTDLIVQHENGAIQLPNSFRPILVARALTKMSSRRKGLKLLPKRDLPKSPEQWQLYQEDNL